MKYIRFICVFILLSAGRVMAQDTTGGILQLNKIPTEGLTLNSGWKFKAGDNPEWAKLNYNDADWIAIDPTDELHHLKEVKAAGIGWFRLNIQVDSSMLEKTVAFIVSGLGASEIYLNGQRLYSFGKVSRDFNKEQTRTCSLPCRFGGKEGLKDFIKYFLRNAVAIVSNF